MRKTNRIPALSIAGSLCALSLACVLFLGNGCILLSHPGLWSPNSKKWYDEDLTQELPGRIALIPFYTDAGYFYGPGAWSRHNAEMPGWYYGYGALQAITLGMVFPYSENLPLLFVKWDTIPDMPQLFLDLDSDLIYSFAHELRTRGLEVKLIDPEEFDFIGLKAREILNQFNKEKMEYDGLLLVRVGYNHQVKDGLKYRFKSVLLNSECDTIFRYHFYFNTTDFELWGKLGDTGKGFEFEDGTIDDTDRNRILNEARAHLKKDFGEFLENFSEIYKPGRE
jgi:hypothetical protein